MDLQVIRHERVRLIYLAQLRDQWRICEQAKMKEDCLFGLP
jgi:hypothetical protein